MPNRRNTLKSMGLAAAGLIFTNTGHTRSLYEGYDESDGLLGHGKFRYKPNTTWGNLNPNDFPVNNCHEMVMDSRGRLIMITDETKNNIIIYDRSGKYLSSWGNEWPGGHGLSLWNEGGEDMLFISDFSLGKVMKYTVDGKHLMTLESPHEAGAYTSEMPYRPTESAVASNGDIFVSDGYGSNYILKFDSNGKFQMMFGGSGNEDDKFSTAHGVAVDYRTPTPTLLCTSRGHNSFKRFTLEGKYIETLFLPGAFVCRPVIHGNELYAGVCWSRLRYLNQTDNSGFITILNKENKVISNPGGTPPKYIKGELQLMVQESTLFKHCHDVCVDKDENLYVCQWNAGKSYPIQLIRS